MHLLINKWVDIAPFREWAVKRGWGPQMFIDPIVPHFNGAHPPQLKDIEARIEKAKRYLAKYLRKGMSGGTCRSAGRHLVGYSAGARHWSAAFAWSGFCETDIGSRLYRVGVRLWADIRYTLGHSFQVPRRCDYREIMKLGFEALAVDPALENILRWSRYEIDYG